MIFAEWYKNNHGYEPFPWQNTLAEAMKRGQFPSITVPTGCGKTVIIAVFQWLHSERLPCPTRLIYVVDRRLIVDSVTQYAEDLGCTVVKMRGGMTIDDSWLMEPNKPTIIVSTVDQAGSRLLFRGYGVSKRTAPIHAALIGSNSLIVLDEAHISTPFANTLEAVKNLQGNSPFSFGVVEMTATPTTKSAAIGLSGKDWVHPVLKKRLFANKKAKLVKVEKGQAVKTMIKEAKKLQGEIDGVIGVICNTVNNARKIFNALPERKILLTGRIRPKDRDKILDEYKNNILCGNRENRDPLFVVATQTIEVGADLDFDGLVTQSAPLSVLRQRFGRLDRLGILDESFAVIVHEDLGSNDECLVYGKKNLKNTFSWLNKVKKKDRWLNESKKQDVVDFGLSAMEESMQKVTPPVYEIDEGATLTERNVLKLRQTFPQAKIDIEPFLHGNQTDTISVSVVWREDLIKDDPEKNQKGNQKDWIQIMEASQPVLQEMMPCPVMSVREWLRNRPVVVNDECKFGNSIKPGDTIIAPSIYGGYDKWGWNPESQESVDDIGNDCGANIRLIGVFHENEIKGCLKQKGLSEKIKTPMGIEYPAGMIVFEEKERQKMKKAVLLNDHATGTLEEIKKITDNPFIHEAAEKHDVGKMEFGFQVRLGNNDQHKPLAKSGSKKLNPPAWVETLPAGWRHEINSLVLLPEETPDLVKYLIATHHGYGRTIMPFWGNMDFWEKIKGSSWGKLTDSLNEEYGTWGLAFLEAQLRLADWIQSRKEQE